MQVKVFFGGSIDLKVLMKMKMKTPPEQAPLQSFHRDALDVQSLCVYFGGFVGSYSLSCTDVHEVTSVCV